MPIVPPRLDDLTYDRVVEDLVRRIPTYAPSWTDHNDSDPGVTLIQLFAHLAEMLGYRLNRVPELVHLQLLELLGIRLERAGVASTRLALLTKDPSRAEGVTVAAGTAARAGEGDPPPVFTTDIEHDLVPADVGVILSTRNPYLGDVLALSGGGREPYPNPAPDPSHWLSVRWDGRKPAAEDLPVEPVVLVSDPAHPYLWLGLRFNAGPSAGFRGVRVDMTWQLDDDEMPTLVSIGACERAGAVAGETPPAVDWLDYVPSGGDAVSSVPGRIDDTTAHLTRSGVVSFLVPDDVGAPGVFEPIQEAGTTGPLEAAAAFAEELGRHLGDADAIGDALTEIADIYRDHFTAALEEVWDDLAPPPQLEELLGDIKDELLERLTADAGFPPEIVDLSGVRDWVHEQLQTVLADLSCDRAGDELVDALESTFFTPITDLLDAGDFADLADALARLQDVLEGIDVGAEAQDIHQLVQGWLSDQLTARLPAVVPTEVVADVVDFFARMARETVDFFWGGFLNEALLTGIAEHYRTAAIDAIDDALDSPPTAALASMAETYADAIAAANEALETRAATISAFVDHPLDPRHRDLSRVHGWLRLTLPEDWISAPGDAPRLRHVGFNVIPASNVEYVGRTVLGTANGRPGQELALPNGDVVPESVELSVQESADPSEPLVPWTRVDSFDTAGPFDRVHTLDAESGIIRFGDGVHGRVPPLVPRAGRIVVSGYRHGGGQAGNVGIAAITRLETAIQGVDGVVNVVEGRGGRDAETRQEAEIRARRELATRHRAVTATDFEWLAIRTPGVGVARAAAIGLRRPLPPDGPAAGIDDPACGEPIPARATGLDDDAVAHGAVTVVVVPDAPDDAAPLPTPTFLRTVCAWLDRHRLLTTELHVVGPQYARLCDVRVELRPDPGFTRAELQARVGEELAGWLHVLGVDGGFGFGRQLHVADLMSRITHIDGVDRVEDIACAFTRTKSNVTPRQGRLVLCPTAPDEVDALAFSAEETVTFDLDSLRVTTVAPT